VEVGGGSGGSCAARSCGFLFLAPLQRTEGIKNEKKNKE
jgi:hypothetical protein